MEINQGDKTRRVPLLQGADLLLLQHQLVEVVAALARVGLVHRDLKPDNVMVGACAWAGPACPAGASWQRARGTGRAACPTAQPIACPFTRQPACPACLRSCPSQAASWSLGPHSRCGLQ